MKQGAQQGQLKLTHICFVILSSHVTVMCLRFIKSTYSCAVKQKDLLKNEKTITCRYIGNILAFDKQSKGKLLSLPSAETFIKNNICMTLGWTKFLLCLNGKVFDFKKAPLR